jgi:glucuronosyltransferase
MTFQDLQKFLDEAKDGFIFFSLGSNIRSDSISNEKRKALLDAFSELPQRVLWKFESDNMPGQPPNLRTGKWLPQSDILGQQQVLPQIFPAKHAICSF